MASLHFLCILPFSVEVKIHSRKVMVKGPRGVLRRNFRHLQVDISKPDAQSILVEKWFGVKAELAAVRTVCSHIENMFKGVMKVRKHKPIPLLIDSE